MVKPPKFRAFLGSDPLNKEDITFHHWIFQVKSSLKRYPELALQEGIITSLRRQSSDLVSFFGTKATVTEIVETLLIQYGQVASTDMLFQNFYQMRQEKKEKVHCLQLG